MNDLSFILFVIISLLTIVVLFSLSRSLKKKSKKTKPVSDSDVQAYAVANPITSIHSNEYFRKHVSIHDPFNVNLLQKIKLDNIDEGYSIFAEPWQDYELHLNILSLYEEHLKLSKKLPEVQHIISLGRHDDQVNRYVAKGSMKSIPDRKIENIPYPI